MSQPNNTVGGPARSFEVIPTAGAVPQTATTPDGPLFSYDTPEARSFFPFGMPSGAVPAGAAGGADATGPQNLVNLASGQEFLASNVGAIVTNTSSSEDVTNTFSTTPPVQEQGPNEFMKYLQQAQQHLENRITQVQEASDAKLAKALEQVAMPLASSDEVEKKDRSHWSHLNAA